MLTQSDQTRQMFIGGRWVDSNSGRTYRVHNPAQGRVLASVPLGDREDVGLAVDAAKAAFRNPVWGDLDPSKRGRLIFKIAASIRDHLDELARLETTNNGKPLGQAKGDVAYAARLFEYYAGLSDKIQGDTIPLPGNRLDYTVKDPLGVTAHIVPWNYPIAMASRSIAPALAAGNTAVAKPSSFTPLTLLRLAALAKESGLPDGVLNVLTGTGSEVGAYLAEHRDVKLVVLTGSVETGRTVMEHAASNLTRVVLELGGKNPNVVFADADVARAAQGVVDGILTNAGQMCWAGSRLVVQDTIKERLLERVLTLMKSMKLGDGLEPDTRMGPLVAESQRKHVLEYITAGREEGARLLLGGKPPDDERLRQGYFLEPTIFVDSTPEMRIVREEIFGPVLTVQTFESASQAVEISNSTEFGLYAGVWTKDLKTAHLMAKNLETGMVSVNEYPVTFPQSPFGGFKKSGYGFEQGVDAIQNYVQVKNVVVNLD